MKNFSPLILGFFLIIGFTQISIAEGTLSNNQIKKAHAPIEYKELTTGVEIIFAPDGSTWDKIMASGESELLFGDRKDVRKATSKAIMRAKASIAKFFKEKLTSNETLEEITKTISKSINTGNTVLSESERKTVETTVESIANSSEAILKGVLILEQNVNQNDKFVSVKVGLSRKTMKVADSISKDMNRDMTQPNNSRERVLEQYNNGENEIRRSRNYNNF